MRIQQRPQRPLVFAHRGYSARAPENTLPAFELAREAGADGIELDVHRTRDGELVVIHDYDLKRLTGEDGTVEQLDAGELRKRSVGAWFSPEFAGERAPYLSDVFDLIRDSLLYDIEIKYELHRSNGIERDLAELIRKHDLQDQVLVSSFNPYILKNFRIQAPEISTAVIWSDHEDVPPILRFGLGRWISGAPILKPHSPKVTAFSILRNSVLMNRPVLCWTVNTPDEVRRVSALGVSGIISDDPGMVIDTLDENLTE